MTKGGSDWNQTRNHFKREVKAWVGKNKSPDAMLREVKREMLQVNAFYQTQEAVIHEKELQKQQRKILFMQECFWH